MGLPWLPLPRAKRRSIRPLAFVSRFCILAFTRNPPCLRGPGLFPHPLDSGKHGRFRVFLHFYREAYAWLRSSQPRRQFLTRTLAAGAGLWAARHLPAAEPPITIKTGD